jgi:hypothetical protein
MKVEEIILRREDFEKKFPMSKMNVEEIRSLNVTLPFCQIRAGKALFTIELMKDGKGGGRDLVFRTPVELRALIDGLTEVEKYFYKPTPTPVVPEEPKQVPEVFTGVVTSPDVEIPD